MNNYRKLYRKIKFKKARIGVIGLGYVGLPLLLNFARSGFEVTGFDLDDKKTKDVNAGKSYISYIEDTDIISLLNKGFINATCNFKNLNSIDIIFICVPTPLNDYKEPDLSYVLNTTNLIKDILNEGQLVVLTSTTYPGTTTEIVLPLLESSGLLVGEQFFLGYSPEREDPGNKKYKTSDIPKIVSGITDKCLKLTGLIFKNIIKKTVKVSSTEVAEASKLLENVYRSVNIALVNELKIILEDMNIDVWEVIEAAKTKPFGFTPFYPGPGLGGHCIPIDPFYLAWKARSNEKTTRFIELAGEINTYMPYHAVNKISLGLNGINKSINGSRILILGLAYKKDVNDSRESPSLKIISLLQDLGAKVDYNDPYIPYLKGIRKYSNLNMKSVDIKGNVLSKYDCVVIVTDHSKYNWKEIVHQSKLVIDTRNATENLNKKYDNIIKA